MARPERRSLATESPTSTPCSRAAPPSTNAAFAHPGAPLESTSVDAARGGVTDEFAIAPPEPLGHGAFVDAGVTQAAREALRHRHSHSPQRTHASGLQNWILREWLTDRQLSDSMTLTILTLGDRLR
jgi:hypothetical protein